MKNHFRNYMFWQFMLQCVTVVMFFFLVNPQELITKPGSGDGKFSDRVDSFSEYIVRNTVKKNILTPHDNEFFPIITRGYKDHDYSFYPEEYKKYYSNIVVQSIPATAIAIILNLNTEKKLDTYFEILKIANASLFSLLIVGLFLLFCKQEKLEQKFISPFLIGCSSGFIYFSQNLYFASFLIVAPAFFVALQLTNNGRYNKLLLLTLSAIYFLRGYEFATVFTLLTAFSAAIFSTGNINRKFQSAALVFGIVCLAFFVTLILHGILISADSGWAISMGEAYRLAFSNLQLRTATTFGVATPFSSSFFETMNSRWSSSAFSIKPEWPSISELDVILAMMIGLLIRYDKMAVNEKLIYTFGFVGYISWYIFAYQHIMWHSMYDWYIFSLTMGLSFSLLAILYITSFVGHIKNIFLKIVKND